MRENLIKQDIALISTKSIKEFRIIRAKSGVHVYKCRYDGHNAVVKYFENESDRREIANYQILERHKIPTIKTLAIGKSAIVLEDIEQSETWRLGIEGDLQDTDVAKGLANWYFTFHENGLSAPELNTLYFEYDSITSDNLKRLMTKLPEGVALFEFLSSHYDKLRELIFTPAFVLTYNDFYWTNFVVRKDKADAMMFDYNLLGRGYRYSDFRNVCSSLSKQAGHMFMTEYRRLYSEKYGYHLIESEHLEKQIDEVLSPLFALITAYEREHFPKWAEAEREKVINGKLLSKARKLLL